MSEKRETFDAQKVAPLLSEEDKAFGEQVYGVAQEIRKTGEAKKSTYLLRALVVALQKMETNASAENPPRLRDLFTEYYKAHDLPETADLSEAFAEAIVRMASLEKDAVRDALTGLYNRRKFEGDAQQMIERYADIQKDFSLVMMDLDGMKIINDTLGHQAGDEALRVISQIASTSISRAKGDEAYRWAGDEFALLLDVGPEFLPEIMARIQENIRRFNEKSEMPRKSTGTLGFELSASMGGVSASEMPSAFTLNDMVQSVDQKLYEVKAQKKNNQKARVVPQEGFEPPTPSSEDLRSNPLSY